MWPVSPVVHLLSHGALRKDREAKRTEHGQFPIVSQCLKGRLAVEGEVYLIPDQNEIVNILPNLTQKRANLSGIK